MKKRGFTLVEVIAVITILGLLGLIITPIVNSLIEKQKIKTFESSVSGILATAKENSQTDNFTAKAYKFVDGNKLYECDATLTNCSTKAIETDGSIDKGSGYVIVTSSGHYTLEISNGTYCAFKTAYSDIVTSKDSDYCAFGGNIIKILSATDGQTNTANDVRYSVIANNINMIYADTTLTTSKVIDSGTYLNGFTGSINYISNAIYSFKISNNSYCANMAAGTAVINFYDSTSQCK